MTQAATRQPNAVANQDGLGALAEGLQALFRAYCRLEASAGAHTRERVDRPYVSGTGVPAIPIRPEVVDLQREIVAQVRQLCERAEAMLVGEVQRWLRLCDLGLAEPPREGQRPELAPCPNCGRRRALMATWGRNGRWECRCLWKCRRPDGGLSTWWDVTGFRALAQEVAEHLARAA